MRRSKAEAEQTRVEILDAAERLFCKQGVTGTSLDRIAAAAGVTRGAVYWHFKDKSDLLLALRDRYCVPQEQLIEGAAENGHPDPFALLETLGAEVLALFEADEGRQRMFAILATQMPGTPEAAGLDRANNRMWEMLRRLMQQAHAEGMLNPRLSPEEAALLLMAQMNGLISEWLRSGKCFGLAATGTKLLSESFRTLRAGEGRPSP